ncbi:MAG: glycosyl transferase family 2 [Chloroflexota bacterium]
MRRFPKASIIIRAKNEERDIGLTLSMVFRQRMRDFEVIVVDSGSTDRTLEVARRFPVKIIEIPPEKFTYGRALNIGIAASRGEYLVCLSAHAIPADEEWLGNLLSGFDDPEVAGVYGMQIPRPDCNFLEVIGLALEGTNSPYPRLQRRGRSNFSNANSAIRRTLWVQVPFDETLSGAEDFAWAKQVQELGYLIKYEPTARVYHSHGGPVLKIMRRAVRDFTTRLAVTVGILATKPPVLYYPPRPEAE